MGPWTHKPNPQINQDNTFYFEYSNGRSITAHYPLPRDLQWTTHHIIIEWVPPRQAVGYHPIPKSLHRRFRHSRHRTRGDTRTHYASHSLAVKLPTCGSNKTPLPIYSNILTPCPLFLPGTGITGQLAVILGIYIY